MGFLERAMNEAAGWTNKDISVAEMAELIDERIIQKENEIHLENLKSAMKKSWILAIGTPVRQTSYCEGTVTVVREYSILTRTMTMVQLWDNEAKISYFIPKGRESASALCASVLARIGRREANR